MTTVINMHDGKPEGMVRIDRHSIHGNPFPISGGRTRDKAIAEHRVWFLAKVEEDLEYRNAVLALEGKILGCWCKPKACHGDTIVAWLESQKEEAMTTGQLSMFNDGEETPQIKREEARMRNNPHYGAHPSSAELAAAVSDSALAQSWLGTEMPEIKTVEAEETAAPVVEESKVAMVTAHRFLENPNAVYEAFKRDLPRFFDKFPGSSGLYGAARGGDFLAAKVTHELGKPYALEIPHVKYHETYPYPKGLRDDQWNAMLANATEVNYSVPETTNWNWRHNNVRNEIMVHKADIHIIVSRKEPNELVRTERKGGTRACVASMMRQGVTVALWIDSNTGESKWVRLDPRLG